MAVFSLSVRADEVVLKTGKKFEVEKVWRENGQIWIVFHGMRASIPPSKVERIESDSNSGPGSLNLKKEEKANLKKNARSTPPDTPDLQTKYASQTASTHQPAKIEKEQSRIFPDAIFQDLSWGTKISAIKGLEKAQDPDRQDGVAEYLLKKEDLKFGQAALSSIHCAFWRDRLYMVTIRTENQSNFTALRDEVFRLFGKGLRVDQASEKYLWTAVPNDMMLQCSKDGQQGLLWLRSSEIDRQLKLSKISSQASYLKWIRSGK
ncbi:MAG: hypothetical protein WBM69_10975 [Desulfobacterales bacterium]